MRHPARRWPGIPAPTCASSAAATPACGPPSCSRSTIPGSTWCWSRPISAAPAPAAATAAARCPGRPSSSPWNGCSGLTEAIRLVKASEDSIRAIGAFCQRYDVEADYRLDGTLYTATNPAQVSSTDSVIAALERHGINSFAKRPLADVQRPGRLAQAPGGLVLAGCRDGATRQAGSRPAPGRPATGVRLYEGTPMRGLEHGRPAEVVTPTGGSSPAAWCWR